jgi:hypothetical protein
LDGTFHRRARLAFTETFLSGLIIHLNLNQDKDVQLHLWHHMICHLNLRKKQRKLSAEGKGERERDKVEPGLNHRGQNMIHHLKLRKKQRKLTER